MSWKTHGFRPKTPQCEISLWTYRHNRTCMEMRMIQSDSVWTSNHPWKMLSFSIAWANWLPSHLQQNPQWQRWRLPRTRKPVPLSSSHTIHTSHLQTFKEAVCAYVAKADTETQSKYCRASSPNTVVSCQLLFFLNMWWCIRAILWLIYMPLTHCYFKHILNSLLQVPISLSGIKFDLLAKCLWIQVIVSRRAFHPPVELNESAIRADACRQAQKSKQKAKRDWTSSCHLIRCSFTGLEPREKKKKEAPSYVCSEPTCELSQLEKRIEASVTNAPIRGERAYS